LNKDQLRLSLQRVSDIEITLCETLNRVCHPTNIRGIFVVVSWLGDGKAWYMAMLLLPLFYSETGLLTTWTMMKVGGVNLALYKIIKQLIGRARPCEVSVNIALGATPLDQYSFPSGHTMHAVAFSLVIATNHPELAWLLVSFCCLTALSRVVLGLHYPTDVIAGAGIGGSVAAGMLAI
jgi:undecaprenyl-diphosphatase